DKHMELTPEELAALKALAALAPKLQALVAAPPPANPAPAPTPTPTTDTTPAPQPPAPAPAAPSSDDEEKKNDAKGKGGKTEPQPKPLTAAEQERMVNDSLELRDQARTVLGTEYAFRGKSNKQIMSDVVK